MKLKTYLLLAPLLIAMSSLAGKHASSEQGRSLEGQRPNTTAVRAEQAAPRDSKELQPSWKLVRSPEVCLKAGEAGAPTAGPEIVPVGPDHDGRASRGSAGKTVGAYLAMSPARQTSCQR